MKHKLSIILILIIMIFLNISDVGAYSKPSGSFYDKNGKKVTSDQTSDADYYFAIGESCAKDYKNGKEDTCKCKFVNMPKSTKYVYISNLSRNSTGSTLKRAWRTIDGTGEYMVGCYATDSGDTSKYYFLGYSYTDFWSSWSLGEWYSNSYGNRCSYSSTGMAYKYAGSKDEIKKKDLDKGYGKYKYTNIIIGASWACQGKNTSGYDECIGNDGANLVDRDSCPIYAGAKEFYNDGIFLKVKEHMFYVTNNIDTNFTESGYDRLCIGYDKDLEDNIVSTYTLNLSYFKENPNLAGGEYKEVQGVPNAYKLVESYMDGKLSLAKIESQTTKLVQDTLNSMYNNENKGIEIGEITYDKERNLAKAETKSSKAYCDNYLDYLLNDYMVAKKIDLTAFAEKLGDVFVSNCVSSSKVQTVRDIIKNKNTLLLTESDLSGLDLTSEEKSCLLKTSETVIEIEKNTNDLVDTYSTEWLKEANEFWNSGFTGQGISDKKMTCEDLLGPNLVKIVQFVVKLLSIAGAIIAIVNAMISLVPAVVSKDADALKKAQSKCITMAIVLVLILLLPTLLTFIGNIFGYDLSCLQWLSGE